MDVFPHLMRERNFDRYGSSYDKKKIKTKLYINRFDINEYQEYQEKFSLDIVPYTYLIQSFNEKKR